MLTELVKGRTATDVAALPKEELLEEIGIPLTPIRLKCAILGLGVLKVALHKAKGTPLPAEWQSLGDDCSSTSGEESTSRRSRSSARAPSRSSRSGGRRSASTTATAALRARGPLLARRRPALRGRMGRGSLPCDLPPARLGVRPRDRLAPLAARLSSRSRRIRSSSRTASSRWKSHRRCWDSADERYNAYHDEEWGRPVRDERGLYERLCLEGFQSGLSWLTILRKREASGPHSKASSPSGSPRSASATSSGCWQTPRSSATEARSRRRSRTRGRRSPCARRSRCTSSSGRIAPERHERPRAHADWARLDAGVGRPLEGAEAGRFPVRRADDGLRRHAGVRRRQRPSGRLLGARGRRASELASVLTDP